jgi:hypothetical protein
MTTAPNFFRRFVEATNAGTTEVFLAGFTGDALLNDWSRQLP